MNENKLLACTASKISISNVTFTEVGTYTYKIKNTSAANISLSDLVLQNYVSKDQVIGSDAAAGGTSLSLYSTAVLAPGETYTGTYYVSRFAANPESTYPYFIMHVYIGADKCSVSNDAH